jgi:hypothetical protein
VREPAAVEQRTAAGRVDRAGLPRNSGRGPGLAVLAPELMWAE